MRISTAVGEGSAVVTYVHQYLATRAQAHHHHHHRHAL
jgi:hypothetical protein